MTTRSALRLVGQALCIDAGHSEDLGWATIDVISVGALHLFVTKVLAVPTLTVDDNVISIFLKLFPIAEITIER